MKPKDFLVFNRVSQSYDYMSFFPAEKLKGFSLSDDALCFLTQIGLPMWAAPHLHFGDFDGQCLPLLHEWSWRTQEYETDIQAWVIGTAPDESPICLLKTGQLFIYKSSRDRQLLNNSVPQLMGALVACSIMIDKGIAEFGAEEGVPFNRFSKKLLDDFEEELISIDAQSYTEGCFWPEEIQLMKTNRT